MVLSNYLKIIFSELLEINLNSVLNM